MSSSNGSLLTEIQRDVLDESKSLASALRKCVVLGGEANSAPLRTWATRELRGYEPSDELPEFRVVAGALHIDGIAGYNQITGQMISPRSLPEGIRDHVSETYELRAGVGEIEAMIQQAEGSHVHLGLPMGAEIAAHMNRSLGNGVQQITRVYRAVAVVSLRAVLDHVRTRLVELVGELRAIMPDARAEPTEEQVGQALSVAVHGSPNAQVNLVTSQASGHGQSSTKQSQGPETPTEPGFWTTNRKIGAFVVGLATIVGTVVAVMTYVTS
ncbi:hypothetical protein [Streptomyces albidus (ex Kaewkla and Franco 2022)]|uniref:AbiTii domain-containing protein n=1 Tax=Streptomyces albidus (ex Kaewkla and Franco 2022) TaxID=722709 RepID=UPI0015EF8202|nr:hypothetical protein [Streptomyces albidus (ex Kaewkla and Franco 2022)]